MALSIVSTPQVELGFLKKCVVGDIWSVCDVVKESMIGEMWLWKEEKSVVGLSWVSWALQHLYLFSSLNTPLHQPQSTTWNKNKRKLLTSHLFFSSRLQTMHTNLYRSFIGPCSPHIQSCMLFPIWQTEPTLSNLWIYVTQTFLWSSWGYGWWQGRGGVVGCASGVPWRRRHQQYVTQTYLVNTSQASQLEFRFLKEPLPVLECLEREWITRTVNPPSCVLIINYIIADFRILIPSGYCACWKSKGRVLVYNVNISCLKYDITAESPRMSCSGVWGLEQQNGFISVLTRLLHTTIARGTLLLSFTSNQYLQAIVYFLSGRHRVFPLIKTAFHEKYLTSHSWWVYFLSR